MNKPIAVVIILSVVAFASAAAARTFTNTEGKLIEAELVAFDDGSFVRYGVIRLKRDDGQVFTYPLANLSRADQRYVSQDPEQTTSADEDEAEEESAPPIKHVDRLIARLKSVEKRHIDAWRDALTELGVIGGNEFAVAFPTRMSFLYEGTDFDEERHARYLKRLRSLGKAEFGRWRDAFVEGPGIIAGPSWKLVVTLVAEDRLFDASDQYRVEVASQYQARLKRTTREQLPSSISPTAGFGLFEAAINVASNGDPLRDY